MNLIFDTVHPYCTLTLLVRLLLPIVVKVGDSETTTTAKGCTESMPLSRVSQGAKELDVSTEHARRMIRKGLWPIYRLGKKAIRIDVEEIKKLTRGYEEPVKEN